MLFDPFTAAAQVVNFVILVWLLRRVLYGPILRAMAERESRIRREIDEAARLRAEAEAERERLRREVATLAAEQERRLAAARAELEAWRHAQMEAAREEIEAKRARWAEALAREQETALDELRQRVGGEILSLTRLVLRELADSDLEDRVVARFLQRLRELAPDHRARLLAAAGTDGHRVHVRTAHPLGDEGRARLREGLAQALGASVAVEFEVVPELGSGVELRAGGLKVAWSLSEFLADLEERLGAAFRGLPAAGDGRA